MTEVLFGDVSALESTFDEDYLCNKIKNIKVASGTPEPSMFQSDTICPQLFTDPTKPGLAIYDCPGFADTRGTSNEIATGVYLSEIVQHAKRVKLVASIDYDAVKPHADRNKFTDGILPEILDFVLSNEIYEGGVFLLVTKYANVNEDANDRFLDDVIVRSIVKFLKEAQVYAAKKDKKRKSAIHALFDNSWLRTPDGQNYPNIAFSRTITGRGKLSEMESLTRRTQIRAQLLDNPHFVFKPSDRNHFGCPISEAAKLEIRRVEKELCGEAEVRLRAVGQTVVSKFVESAKDHEQLSSFVHQYVMFLQDMKKLTNEESGLTTKSLEAISKFGNNINVKIEVHIKWLNDIVRCLKHLSSVDIEESSAIWRDANGKLDQAKLTMAKDLLMEFRKAQRNLAAEADQVLKMVGYRVVNKFAKATENDFFGRFDVFADNIKKLPREDSGLSDKSLEILREFGINIGDDMGTEVVKLAGIIRCLKYLTGVDVEQVTTTWLDVQMKWDHAIEFMKKDIAQLKAQRDFAEADAQGKLAIARAEAELLEAKTKGELAEAIAQKELAEAKAEAERVKAKAQNDLLLAETEKIKAEAKAKAEIAEARHKAELAEARAKAAAANNKGGAECNIL